MTRLSVNVNKIATLRNSRGGARPNLLKTVDDIVRFGAEGITIHPRPDERHIKRSDVFEIKKILSEQYPHIELNIEGYPSIEFLQLMEEIRPHLCTLVPDAPNVLTSNAGWDVKKNISFLKSTIHRLQKNGCLVSLFIDPFNCSLPAIVESKTNCIELYTEMYAQDASTLLHYSQVAEEAKNNNIEVNAGHDLDSVNLPPLIKVIPFIREVSIGHALICDALNWGLEKTLQTYLLALKPD